MSCEVCDHAATHGWWGLDAGASNNPRHHCRKCHRTWRGYGTVHCVTCHRHFASHSTARKHQRLGEDWHPVCTDPAGKGLLEDENGVWHRPGSPPPRDRH